MTVTLLTLRTRARERADMVNSRFVEDAELNRYINAAAKKYYDKLIEAYNLRYSKNPPASVSVVSGTDTYPLPSDFYKLLGVDVTIDGRKRDVKPFIFAERNRGNYETPSANYTVTLWYAPVLADLSADGDTIDTENGWEEYIILDAAIAMRLKEESDVADLMFERKAMEDRISGLAANRDAGSPERVVEVGEDEVGYPISGESLRYILIGTNIVFKVGANYP